MSTIWVMAHKDLRLLVRDRFGMFWALVFPLVYGIFFGMIVGGGGSGAAALPIALIDLDRSKASEAFADRLRKSTALNVRTDLSQDEAKNQVRLGKLTAFVVVPEGFDKASLFGGGKTTNLEVGIDPARKAEAGVLEGILMQTAFEGLQDQMRNPKEMRARMQEGLKALEQDRTLPAQQRDSLAKSLNQIADGIGGLDQDLAKENGPGGFQPVGIEKLPVTADPNRPLSPFEITFPSSVLWGMMGCVTTFAISLVTERRAGTLLRLCVAPLSWGEILAGKALACLVACMTVTVVLLLVGRLLGVRLDNWPALLLAIPATAFCFVGIMMFLSTLGKTERGTAGAAWGLMMPFAMIGGAMVPLIAMPGWMQTVSNVSPVKWGILALEGAVWRGFGLVEMLLPCAILLGVGAACLALGVWRIRRSEI